MDVLAAIFIDGNVILKIVVLQVAAAVFVLFLLKKLLERELFVCALEKISSFPEDQGAGVEEVVVVAAGKLSGDEEFRLRTVIKARCPQAEVIVGQDRTLWGGVVIRAGGNVLDFSLWTKVRQLFKHADV